MALQSLNLVNFRSYSRARFDFAPQLNLIVGPNGAGKTNLLEAIYVLANTKSWRQNDRNLIQNEQQEYKLTGVLKNKNLGVSGRLGELSTQKSVFINQTKAKPQDYLGSLKTVLFEPESLNIIYGGPENRRRWLNQVLASDPVYLANLLRYRRIIKQRNALLKSGALASIKDQIFAWDINLTEAAAAIVEQRLRLVKFFNQEIEAAYQLIANQPTDIGLNYQIIPEALAESSHYATDLVKLLDSNLERDWRFNFTTVGPHRDDVTITFKNRPVSQVASRGEARTLVLAIKLLEHQWLSRAGDVPILLFDDIFSELDQARRRRALSQLKSSQIFITSTDDVGLKVRYGGRHQQIKLTK